LIGRRAGRLFRGRRGWNGAGPTTSCHRVYVHSSTIGSPAVIIKRSPCHSFAVTTYCDRSAQSVVCCCTFPHPSHTNPAGRVIVDIHNTCVHFSSIVIISCPNNNSVPVRAQPYSYPEIITRNSSIQHRPSLVPVAR
jgi:hypothetical protein